MEGYTLVGSKRVLDGVAEFVDLEHNKQYRVKIVADDDNGYGTVAESYVDYWTQAPLKQDPAFIETNGQALKFSNVTETSFTVSYSFTHPYALIEHFIFLYDTLDNLISTFDMGKTEGMVSTDRSLTITDLTSKNYYNVRLACSDRYGNASLNFGSITMPDLTKPVLSETSAVKTGTTTAEVKWKVTDLSDVTVTVRHFETATLDLGIPIGTSTSKVKDALQTLQLTNLKANTDYTVYIQAQDETNPETPVIIHTFKTDTAVVSLVGLTFISRNSKILDVIGIKVDGIGFRDAANITFDRTGVILAANDVTSGIAFEYTTPIPAGIDVFTINVPTTTKKIELWINNGAQRTPEFDIRRNDTYAIINNATVTLGTSSVWVPYTFDL